MFLYAAEREESKQQKRCAKLRDEEARAREHGRGKCCSREREWCKCEKWVCKGDCCRRYQLFVIYLSLLFCAVGEGMALFPWLLLLVSTSFAFSFLRRSNSRCNRFRSSSRWLKETSIERSGSLSNASIELPSSFSSAGTHKTKNKKRREKTQQKKKKKGGKRKTKKRERNATHSVSLSCFGAYCS